MKKILSSVATLGIALSSCSTPNQEIQFVEMNTPDSCTKLISDKHVEIEDTMDSFQFAVVSVPKEDKPALKMLLQKFKKDIKNTVDEYYKKLSTGNDVTTTGKDTNKLIEKYTNALREDIVNTEGLKKCAEDAHKLSYNIYANTFNVLKDAGYFLSRFQTKYPICTKGTLTQLQLPKISKIVEEGFIDYTKNSCTYSKKSTSESVQNTGFDMSAIVKDVYNEIQKRNIPLPTTQQGVPTYIIDTSNEQIDIYPEHSTRTMGYFAASTKEPVELVVDLTHKSYGLARDSYESVIQHEFAHYLTASYIKSLGSSKEEVYVEKLEKMISPLHISEAWSYFIEASLAKDKHAELKTQLTCIIDPTYKLALPFVEPLVRKAMKSGLSEHTLPPLLQGYSENISLLTYFLTILRREHVSSNEIFHEVEKMLRLYITTDEINTALSQHEKLLKEVGTTLKSAPKKPPEGFQEEVYKGSNRCEELADKIDVVTIR